MTESSPDRPDRVSLCSLALALAGRLLPPGSNRDEAPEEGYLHEQRFRLAALAATEGDDVACLLRGYLKDPAPRDRPLLQLYRRLGLAPVELLAAALALGVEYDPWVGRVLAFLQAPLGGGRPTLGLLESAFAPLVASGAAGSGWVAGAICGGDAVASGLLQRVNLEAPLPEQALKVATPLALALAGARFAWPGEAAEEPVELPSSLREEAVRHAAALAGENRVLVLQGPSREGASLAAELARALKRTALVLDADRMEPRGLGPLCLVRRLLPVIRYRLGPGEHGTIPLLPGYRGPILVLKEYDGTVSGGNGNLLLWELPVPSLTERVLLWNGYLADEPLAERVARGHLHGAARIAELAAGTRHAAALRGQRPAYEDVQTAAWRGEGGLGALARPIPDRIADQALVLPAPLRAELEMLVARCTLRESLAERLGATLAARYRVGVRALFTGPSGTGKTLAAAWLATALGMPLYQVDLASVTSKYIGETEKNLATLLARAEQAEVILLFDEADALFGKRTDVKDANDRFANAQTNYLLQRIESYRGIVLLTSNSRNRFDPAFTRRIDVILEFPLPGPAERRDLWRAHLGEGNLVTPAEINRIAACADLCGGHIRNAVLSAAVLARREDRAVGFEDLARGVQIEYRKLGRQLPHELVTPP